jgi:crotonobetainyl-CoA:carnitine CoA-transferase CaiB-like acyl-CoA transferase
MRKLQIVNLAVNLPGPAAARRFVELGAQVIKIEPPAGDPMEQYHAGWYRDMAAGQTILRLDLKTSTDRERLGRILVNADLLITASRPAALERLHLDWSTLHKKYPQLCQVAIVGYPAPRQNEAGHDLTYQAALGLLTPPHMPRTLLADMAGAEKAISAAMTLLLARQRGASGGYTEVALSDAAAAMAEPLRYATTSPGANLGGGRPEYNLYATTDGWVAVAALEPHFKERLESTLGIQSDEEYRQVFATRGAAAWQEWGQQVDVPIAAVR